VSLGLRRMLHDAEADDDFERVVGDGKAPDIRLTTK
jgi:hypothetical protein